jgi:hypothetical protein
LPLAADRCNFFALTLILEKNMFRLITYGVRVSSWSV